MIDGKSFNAEEIKKEPLDREIKKLVYLINKVDGVETIESCFGHHKMPCRIWLRIKNIDTANKFIRQFFYFDPLWSLKLTFVEADYFDELLFVIESGYQDYPTVDLMVENLIERFEKRMKECYKCGFNDEDYGCTCSHSNKWYACPIENSKPENIQAMKEYVEWLLQNGSQKRSSKE